MSNPEENPAIEVNAGSLRARTVTVVPSREGEDAMGLRSVGRYEEIRRRLADGRGVREIARALGCAHATVREVRDGARVSPDSPKLSTDPLWMRQLAYAGPCRTRRTAFRRSAKSFVIGPDRCPSCRRNGVRHGAAYAVTGDSPEGL